MPGRSLKTEEREPKASAGGSGASSRGRTSSNEVAGLHGALVERAIGLLPVGDVESVATGSLIFVAGPQGAGTEVSMESLILAQDERWRRA